MMVARKARDPRRDWEEARTHAVSLGGYGHRVRLFVEHGRIKATWAGKQRTLGPDTPEGRERAYITAHAMSEQLRRGETEAPAQKIEAATLTLFDALNLYAAGRIPGWEPWLVDARNRDVYAWYDALPESVRSSKLTPKASTVIADLVAWRRVFKYLPRETLYMDLDAGDFSAAARKMERDGLSPRTVANTLDRVSNAFRWIVRQRGRSMGILFNPADGRQLDRSRASIPEYTPQEATALWQAAQEQMQTAPGKWWRIWAATNICSSGRRIGSVLALTADDHDFTTGEVVWRAEAAKGDNYGRGDERVHVTGRHRAAVLWCLANQPNPVGSSFPIIYSRDNPRRHSTHSTLREALHALEAAAGVRHVPGRAFHSFRRAMVTVLGDDPEVGIDAAAEYVGMTSQTARQTYKRTQAGTMSRVARAVDRATGGGE